MIEYVFNKEELKRMIDSATDAESISVKVTFSLTAQYQVFSAVVTATPIKADGTEDRTTPPVAGCPKPPGCGW